ncbi:MAG: hypothetical protein QNK04_10760 [Myxococcota bacterium]|nr:hypothetical protein [Myxococcota bacterium]
MARFLMMVFLLFLAFFASNTIRQQSIKQGLNDFETICTDECALSADRALCAPICSCMLDTMKEQHPTEGELVAYLTDLGNRFEREGEAGTPELQPIADACAERLFR